MKRIGNWERAETTMGGDWFWRNKKTTEVVMGEEKNPPQWILERDNLKDDLCQQQT